MNVIEANRPPKKNTRKARVNLELITLEMLFTDIKLYRNQGKVVKKHGISEKTLRKILANYRIKKDSASLQDPLTYKYVLDFPGSFHELNAIVIVDNAKPSKRIKNPLSLYSLEYVVEVIVNSTTPTAAARHLNMTVEALQSNLKKFTGVFNSENKIEECLSCDIIKKFGNTRAGLEALRKCLGFYSVGQLMEYEPENLKGIIAFKFFHVIKKARTIEEAAAELKVNKERLMYFIGKFEFILPLISGTILTFEIAKLFETVESFCEALGLSSPECPMNYPRIQLPHTLLQVYVISKESTSYREAALKLGTPPMAFQVKLARNKFLNGEPLTFEAMQNASSVEELQNKLGFDSVFQRMYAESTYIMLEDYNLRQIFEALKVAETELQAAVTLNVFTISLNNFLKKLALPNTASKFNDFKSFIKDDTTPKRLADALDFKSTELPIRKQLKQRKKVELMEIISSTPDDSSSRDIGSLEIFEEMNNKKDLKLNKTININIQNKIIFFKRVNEPDESTLTTFNNSSLFNKSLSASLLCKLETLKNSRSEGSKTSEEINSLLQNFTNSLKNFEENELENEVSLEDLEEYLNIKKDYLRVHFSLKEKKICRNTTIIT